MHIVPQIRRHVMRSTGPMVAGRACRNDKVEDAHTYRHSQTQTHTHSHTYAEREREREREGGRELHRCRFCLLVSQQPTPRAHGGLSHDPPLPRVRARPYYRKKGGTAIGHADRSGARVRVRVRVRSRGARVRKQR
eukprot:778635-Pleurochrysis_carterae.AAC.1